MHGKETARGRRRTRDVGVWGVGGGVGGGRGRERGKLIGASKTVLSTGCEEGNCIGDFGAADWSLENSSLNRSVRRGTVLETLGQLGGGGGAGNV